MRLLPWIAKILTLVFVLALILDIGSVHGGQTPVAKAQISLGVGGIFAPGVFDIYSPSYCGPLVSVVGPNPGVFVFAAFPYDYFADVPEHIGLNTVGLAEITPAVICPPILIETSSSLLPGYVD